MVATPTKTLRFDSEVLDTLRDKVVWSADGLSAELPPLHRTMYDKVSKAFKLMGGSWNRKAGATLFEADPRPMVEGLIHSGTMVVERDGFFPTPPEVSRYILARMAVVGVDYNWLEPEAGDGAMVKALLDIGQRPERIYAIERNASRCETLRKLGVRVANKDFLQYRHSNGVIFNRILMNPPFENGQDILHVMKAYYVLAEGGVMGAVMSPGPFNNSSVLAKNFRSWFKGVGGYREDLPEGSFKASGTKVNTCFIILHK